MHFKKLLFQFVVCITTNSLMGNNVQVSNISLQNRNTVAKTNMIHFDVSWENSWRTSTLESNWDAVWVFAKYRVKGQQNWEHATLDITGHTGPSTCKIDSVSDGKGVFIKSNADLALSNVNYQNIELKWLYGTDGLQDNDSVEVCVFAIEMVYVPQGAFYAGDGVSSNTLGVSYITGSLPYQITSSGAFSMYEKGNSSSISIQASFPEGYNGFYCMKYEMTQGQYADYLNKLTNVQASLRFSSSSASSINGAWPNFSASAPYKACNNISGNDALFFANWACLRPMSELEFEKACRGTLNPVAGEYAWGTTNYTTPVSIVNAGADDEVASNSTANIHVNNSSLGVMRVGFAQGTTREETGSTYYGIRDMSGNLGEITVSIGISSSYSYSETTNGDGSYGIGTGWPNGFVSYFKLRGGEYISPNSKATVSDRSGYGLGTMDTRASYHGFRAVRSY